MMMTSSAPSPMYIPATSCFDGAAAIPNSRPAQTQFHGAGGSKPLGTQSAESGSSGAGGSVDAPSSSAFSSRSRATPAGVLCLSGSASSDSDW